MTLASEVVPAPDDAPGSQTSSKSATVVTVSPRRRLIGRIAVGIWLVVMIASFLTRGIPFDRLAQTLWILSGFAVIAIGRPWSRMRQVLLDWGIFVGIFYLYDLSRAGATYFNFPVQITFGINADKLMFGGIVPTVWLQQNIYDPSAVHWWDTVGSVIYITHFLAAWIIAAVLYLISRDAWFDWARAVVITSVSALVIFMLVPTAPPWYADERAGLLPPIDRIAVRGLDSIGLHPAGELVSSGRAFSNEVAAIPSLHTGFAVLVSLFLFSVLPRTWRWWATPLLVLYPVAMIVVLVYSGEHYVIDGIFGAILAVGVWFGLRRYDQWRKQRKDRAAYESSTAAEIGGSAPVASSGQ
jgi:membrane-associated phospholipid phosphatase